MLDYAELRAAAQRLHLTSLYSCMYLCEGYYYCIDAIPGNFTYLRCTRSLVQSLPSRYSGMYTLQQYSTTAVLLQYYCNTTAVLQY